MPVLREADGELDRSLIADSVADITIEQEELDKFELNRGKGNDERDNMQKKTFTKWVNKHLTKAGIVLNDLFEDLRDGSALIALLEALTDESIQKENGKTRFHRIQNVQTCLDFLKKKNVKLVNIRSEDIVEGNAKLTMGLIWTIILHFQVSVIRQRLLLEAEPTASGSQSTEKTPKNDVTSARVALLQMAQKVTADYPLVTITNFSSSWRDGLAFNAIIHHYRPAAIDWYRISDESVSNRERLDNAFITAEKEFGVERLLDAEDVDTNNPDEKSIITYVSSLYNALPQQPASDKWQKVQEIYIEESRDWIQWVEHSVQSLEDQVFLEPAAELIGKLKIFRDNEMLARDEQRQRLCILFHRFEITLQGSSSFIVPNELGASVLQTTWSNLQVAVEKRFATLNEMVAQENVTKEIVSDIEEIIKNSNLKLDLIGQCIEQLESRIETSPLEAIEKEITELTEELGNVDLVEDEKLQNVNDAPGSDEIRCHAGNLQERITAYHLRLVEQVLPKAKAHAEDVEKVRLLEVAQNVASDYSLPNITDFSSSWRDGLALNAIIHHFRPSSIDWFGISDESVSNRERLDNAFLTAEKEFGVKRLLNAEDVDTENPDEKAINAYVSSLYNALPPQPAANKWQKVQKKYIKEARDWIQWVEQSVQSTDDRAITEPATDLISKLEEFRDNDMQTRDEQRQRLSVLYQRFEKTIQDTKSFIIPSELSASVLQTAWTNLQSAVERRFAALNEMVAQENAMKEIITQVETIIGTSNKQLDLIDKRIEELESRIETSPLETIEKEIDGLVEELKSVDLVEDENLQTIQNSPRSEDIRHHARSLQQRRSTNNHRLVEQILPRARAHAEKLEKARLLDLVQNMTADYSLPNITNFSSSWRDGLALNAIIHHFRPSSIDWFGISDESVSNRERLDNAFLTAEKEFGVKRLLNADDVDSETPDEKAINAYVSSLYSALPPQPASNKWQKIQKKYIKEARVWIQWVEHSVKDIGDRAITEPATDLISRLEEFQNNEMQTRDEQRQRLSVLYQRFEKTIQDTKSFIIPSELSASVLQTAWSNLQSAVERRFAALNEMVAQENAMKALVSQMENDIEISNGQLDLIDKRIEELESRIETSPLETIEKEIDGLVEELKSVDLVEDKKLLDIQNASESEEIRRRAENLQQRRYAYQHRLADEVLPKARTHAEKVEKARLLDLVQNMTADYSLPNITDFSSSWRDGLALNAIIHHFRSSSIDWFGISDESVSNRERLDNAFLTAEKEFGVKRLLNADDVDTENPDEKAINAYVSSLYNALPPQPAADKWQKVQKKYIKEARDWIQWVEHSVQSIDDRVFNEPAAELIDKLEEFQNNDMQARDEQRQSLALLFHRFEMTIKDPKSFIVPNELGASALQAAWTSIQNAVERRFAALNKLIKQENTMKETVSDIKQVIKNSNVKLDMIGQFIEQLESRIETSPLEAIEKEITELTEELGNVDLVEDEKLQNVNDAPGSDEIRCHAGNLQERITAYHLRLVEQVLPKAKAHAEDVEKVRLLEVAQNVASDYSLPNITDFSSSWRDGLALNAIIHHFRPSSIDWFGISDESVSNRERLDNAFLTAEKEFGVKRLLNADDVDTENPDENAINAYVSSLYNALPPQPAAYKWQKVQKTYMKEARDWIQWVEQSVQSTDDRAFTEPATDLISRLEEFRDNDMQTRDEQRQRLSVLYQRFEKTIQDTKSFIIPSELSASVLQTAWTNLQSAVERRFAALNEMVAQENAMKEVITQVETIIGTSNKQLDLIDKRIEELESRIETSPLETIEKEIDGLVEELKSVDLVEDENLQTIQNSPRSEDIRHHARSLQQRRSTNNHRLVEQLLPRARAHAEKLEKARLLDLVQNMTADYSLPNITNFSSSWRDGLALNAIIHHFRPSSIDWFGISDESVSNRERLDNAFLTAEKEFGVKRLLNADDVDTENPDEKAINAYVSSLYNALPQQSASDKWQKVQKTYMKEARDWIQWVEHSVQSIDDRVFNEPAAELIDKLEEFQNNDMQARDEQRQRLALLFHRFEMTIKDPKSFIVPNELGASALQAAWTSLQSSMERRLTELNELATKENAMKTLVSQIENDIEISNGQLGVISESIKDLESRIETSPLEIIEKEIAELTEELGNVDPVDEEKLLDIQKASESEEIRRRAENLRQRRSTYHHLLVGQLLPKAKAHAEKLDKVRLLKVAQNVASDYSLPNITDFSSSWRDGLALNAIIHHFRPSSIDWFGISDESVSNRERLDNAFLTAEKEFGVKRLLNAEDVDTENPDENAINAYVSSLYNALPPQPAANKWQKVQKEYIEEARDWIQWVEQSVQSIDDRVFNEPAAELIDKLEEFQNNDMQTRDEQRQRLSVLYQRFEKTIQDTKSFIIPSELSASVLQTAWTNLQSAVERRFAALNEMVAQENAMKEVITQVETIIGTSNKQLDLIDQRIKDLESRIETSPLETIEKEIVGLTEELGTIDRVEDKKLHDIQKAAESEEIRRRAETLQQRRSAYQNRLADEVLPKARAHAEKLEKARLLDLVQNMTADYSLPNITNFSSSWRDGFALNAIIHHFRPSSIDWFGISDESVSNRERLDNAFLTAEKEFGVKRLLNADDVDSETPDENAITAYVSSLYSALPPQPAANKWQEAQEMYIEESRDWIQWVEHSVQSIDDRVFNEPAAELIDKLEEFQDNEMPVRDEQRQRLALLFHRFEMTIIGVEFIIPTELNSLVFQKYWTDLTTAVERRFAALNELAADEIAMKRAVSMIEKVIGNPNQKMDSIEKRINELESHIETAVPVLLKKEVVALTEELENVNVGDDEQLQIVLNAPESDGIRFQVESLSQRRSDYRQFVEQVLARVRAREEEMKKGLETILRNNEARSKMSPKEQERLQSRDGAGSDELDNAREVSFYRSEEFVNGEFVMREVVERIDEDAELEELKRLEGWTWQDWKERYVLWNDEAKSRVTDLFRRIDSEHNGLVPRQVFIDGVIGSKFPTSRLEMKKVADRFDKGDGMINSKEFINAIRFQRDAEPTTEPEKITHEIERQKETCSCCQQFQMEQVGESQYKFGDTQIKRMVRILRSTVMVRVGGGWETLEEFLHKHDPCRTKGRLNVARLPEVKPDSASDSMRSFTKNRHALPFAGAPGAPGTPGPIVKIREKTERSVPMSGGLGGTAGYCLMSPGAHGSPSTRPGTGTPSCKGKRLSRMNTNTPKK